MYSKELLNHFQNPRNAGELPSPTATAQVENPACGDVLQLGIKVEHAKITEARFRAKGCVAAIACGSLLTEMLQGMTTEQARRVRREDLISRLGGLPPESVHASHLAIDVLSAVLAKL
jgi:nitrogen fixation NifU-like protein